MHTNGPPLLAAAALLHPPVNAAETSCRHSGNSRAHKNPTSKRRRKPVSASAERRPHAPKCFQMSIQAARFGHLPEGYVKLPYHPLCPWLASHTMPHKPNPTMPALPCACKYPPTAPPSSLFAALACLQYVDNLHDNPYSPRDCMPSDFRSRIPTLTPAVALLLCQLHCRAASCCIERLWQCNMRFGPSERITIRISRVAAGYAYAAAAAATLVCRSRCLQLCY